MVSISVKPAQTSPTPTTRATPPKVDWLEFVGHLARKHAVSGDLVHKLADHQKKQKKLRELWELTDLSASDFADETASFYELARLDLPQLLGAASLVGRISPRFLRETSVFPCRLAEGQTILVVADPSDETAIHAAELALGCPITIAVASFEDIATVLSERLADDTPAAIDVGETLQHHREADVESLRDLASGAPVVRAVNDLLEKALELRATDIHIEPFRTGLAVRMRVDGLLRPLPAPSDVLPQALVSRIKILAGLNIAERRLPQDGAAHLRVSRSDVDIRVATMPTQHGESAAIRLLAKDRGVLEIPKLGFSTTNQEKLRRLLQLPHGIVVVTGPTGSGKTTTLATMLTALNDTTRKILTIEDPVEYEIRGINQSQVNRKSVLPSPLHYEPSFVRILMSSWSARCATRKLPTSPSMPPSRAIWFSQRYIPKARPRPSRGWSISASKPFFSNRLFERLLRSDWSASSANVARSNANSPTRP